MVPIKLIERDDVRLTVPDWRTQRFRDLLAASGFSQQEMAVFMGVTYSYVRQFKSGANITISADKLRLLAFDLALLRGEIQ